ncbi:MAG TPA: ATP-binding protein [Jiangellaceae bacterium]
MSWVRRLSLRARLTLAATVVAVLGLVAGGLLLLVALDRALLSALDESARADGGDIAALVDAGRLTDPLPTFGAAVAQVVDLDGRVRASTPGGDRLAPIIGPDELAAVRDGEAIDLDGTRLGQPDPYRVVGVAAGPPDDPQTVVVAVSLAEQERSSRILKTGVGLGGLILTAAVAGLSWIGIGRALRPVEGLRAGAEEISGTAALDRLPVPEADDEIRRLATTLNDMLARLESASARQRAFVADAAHELRSPIAALRTQLEVALAHREAVDPHVTAREALVEVERMGRLVDDLLVLARVDEAGRAARDTAIDLRACAVDEAARLPHRRVPVRATPGPPVEIRGDADGLARVIRNLLENAVRHAESEVSVSVDGYAREVLLTVTDDGPGIAQADRARVFDRFARLDDARARDDGGTGLGLAIVREIVTAHGGSVRVEDAGPGARFVVRLSRSR